MERSAIRKARQFPAPRWKWLKPLPARAFKTTTDEKGYWALPSLPTGVYKVTVTHAGFKSVTNDNVVIDAGVPATVNVTLDSGRHHGNGGGHRRRGNRAEHIARPSRSTLQGRQINDLPFTSHNVTELIASQPGTQNADGVRYATINGLPQTTINITIDGINVQDNADQEQSGCDLQRRAAAHPGDRGNDDDHRRRRRRQHR